MRPLKLTLQAFGAYPERIEIPFEKLGSNNIYLIYGPTGSGKTTIFDAISYALFSSPSGQYRKNQNLRSHYIGDDVETLVQLEFLYNGEKYCVFRTIKVNKDKIKTSSLINLPNSKVIIGNKETDEYILNLLGINASQFSQIALLAQGEFMKLLNSDTKTRSEIFRNIFKTFDYKLFQEKLKFLAASYHKSYDEQKNSIIQYCQQVESENEDILNYSKNYQSAKNIVEFDDFLNLIKEQNASDKKELSILKSSLDEINNKIIENEKSLQLELNKQKLIQNQKNLIKNFETQKESYEKIKIEYNKLPEKENIEKDLILKIEKSKQDYENSILIKELKENNKKYFINLKDLEEKLNENNKKIDDLKNNYLKFILNQYFDFDEKLKNSQSELLKLQKEFNNLNELHNFEYNRYIASQAGILASELKEHMPCPVCGSKEHPNIAKLPNEIVSKDELDEIKKKLEKKSEKLAEKSRECSLINEKKEQKLLEFKNEKKRLKIEILFEKSEVKNIDYLSEIEKSEILKEKNTKDIDLIKLEIEKNNTKITTLNKNQTDFDVDENLKIYENLKIQKDVITAEIKSTKEAFEKESTLFSELGAKLEVINKQIEDYSKIKTFSKDELEECIFKNNMKKNELTKRFNFINSRFSINEKLLAKLVDCYKKYNEIESTYLEYDILSKCANGDIKGKQKIEFEQYIQAYYLDLVLFEANKRLQVMTKNQFMLLRKKDFTSIQSKESLELEVMDFHTCKKRSTKTLSGGESFMAALSLALGLSDCISGYSNVSIDAMFIDEGFGSLDFETLQNAMDVIVDLTSSNKLVGIISHVDDLKNRIQNQILTYKSDHGSKIEINF